MWQVRGGEGRRGERGRKRREGGSEEREEGERGRKGREEEGERGRRGSVGGDRKETVPEVRRKGRLWERRGENCSFVNGAAVSSACGCGFVVLRLNPLKFH